MVLRGGTEGQLNGFEKPITPAFGQAVGAAMLTEIQERRFAMSFGLGELMPMTDGEIAQAEGVSNRAITGSVQAALRRLDRNLWFKPAFEPKPEGMSDEDWDLKKRISAMPFHRIELLELRHRGFSDRQIYLELEGIGSIDLQLDKIARKLGIDRKELEARTPHILRLAGELPPESLAA